MSTAKTAYQQLIDAKYPFERTVPENSEDIDVLMDHIMKISFLSNRESLKQQALMQAAEEYSIQQCQIQCKKDGRMKREKEDEVGHDGKMKLNQGQLLAQMEKEMSDKGMTKEERKRLEQTKAFHAALESIPWTELNEPSVAEHVPKSTVEDDGKPKPFLTKSIFNAPTPLTAAEEAELNFDVKRGVATIEGSLNDDEDVDDKKPVTATNQDNDDDNDRQEKKNIVLKPAIPEDAVAPIITEEMLALDPNNPEIVPQPIKERENRFSYAAKFGDEFETAALDKNVTEDQFKDILRAKKAAHAEKWKEVDENVAGFVADGSVVPLENEGKLARADLPPVYHAATQRSKVLRGKYDPALDKPFLWSKNFVYIVVSMIGPDCPQQAPRRMFRVWGGVKTKKEGKDLMDEVIKRNPYGSWWRTYLYSIQRWIAFPPKGQTKDDNGTVMEGNNEYCEYQQAFMDHQKHVAVELEQRGLDAKVGEKTAGQSIIEQLKQKNMNVPGGVDASMIPRNK